MSARYIHEMTDVQDVVRGIRATTDSLSHFLSDGRPWAAELVDAAKHSAFLDEIAVAGELLARLTELVELRVVDAAEFAAIHREITAELRTRGEGGGVTCLVPALTAPADPAAQKGTIP